MGRSEFRHKGSRLRKGNEFIRCAMATEEIGCARMHLGDGRRLLTDCRQRAARCAKVVGDHATLIPETFQIQNN